VGLFVLATPIIAVSFERGAFGAEGVRRASDALRMLALAILPAGAVGLVARTYYAVGDFRTPVRVSVVLLALNAVLNLVFVRAVGMDVAGLALATAISSALHLAWLLAGFGRRLGLPAALPGFWPAAGRMGMAAGACGLAAFGAEALLGPRVGRGAALLAAMAAGAVVYFGLVASLGVPEWRGFRERLGKRIGRS
jgi:putative peptidoglycan lipid II flippase